MTERYGIPSGRSSMRIARTLLALHVAGERGILAPDLIDRVQASKATVYRALATIRAAGWRIDSAPERVDGVMFARLSLARAQRLPRQIPAAPNHSPTRGTRARTVNP